MRSDRQQNMTQKLFPYLLSCLLCFILQSTGTAQPDSGVHQLRGRLVEVVNGKTVGVPGVTIRVPGQWEDKTGDDGTFTLSLSKAERYVELELVPANYEFIFPDIVNLPPSNTFVKILVCCGEETDQQFKSQVVQLDKKIDQTIRQRKISKRQINQLKRQLIDTVLYYQTVVYLNEQSIQKLEANLEAATTENQALQDSLASYQEQLQKAHQQISVLSQELYAALEEKFLRQQEHYTRVSTGLQNYLDRLKDLRDWLPQLGNYFRHPQAQQQFNVVVTAYSEAWRHISTEHEKDLSAVAHYWENLAVMEHLELVDRYILDTIHKDVMLTPFNEMVIRPIQQWSSRQMALGPARKKATKGAQQIKDQLDPLIEQLEVMIQEMEGLFDVAS